MTHLWRFYYNRNLHIVQAFVIKSGNKSVYSSDFEFRKYIVRFCNCFMLFYSTDRLTVKNRLVSHGLCVIHSFEIKWNLIPDNKKYCDYQLDDIQVILAELMPGMRILPIPLNKKTIWNYSNQSRKIRIFIQFQNQIEVLWYKKKFGLRKSVGNIRTVRI